MRKKGTGRRFRNWAKDDTTFLAVLLATFFSLSMIVGLAFGSFYKSLRKNAITIGSMTVAYEAHRIEEALYSSFNTLLVSSYTVDSMLQKGASPQDVEEYMIQETDGIISGMDPDFSGLYGVIQDIYVDGIGWQPDAGYDPYTRPWYTAAAEKQGAPATVSPYLDAQTGSILLSFSKILCDGKSAISLDVHLDSVYDITREIQLSGNGYCFLMDKNGQVIAHRDAGQIGGNYLADSEYAGTDLQVLAAQIVACTEPQIFQDVRVDGDSCMVFTNCLQGEWSLVLVVRTADLYEGFRGSFLYSILVSLVIFLIVGYFCTSNYHNKKRALRYAENLRTDALTGLNNRGEFDRYLSVAAASVSPERKLYLLMFDADNFKGINDCFGHQEGDRALQLIARALMSACHGTDWFCARYGGDEFVVLCKSGSDVLAKEIISDIEQRLTTLAAESGLPYAITLSCGYACYGSSAQPLSDLIIAADHALYQKKAEKKQAVPHT